MDVYCNYISFEPGGFALLLTKHFPLKHPESSKLKPLWVGPYKIVYACGYYAYKLVYLLCILSYIWCLILPYFSAMLGILHLL